jgi:hypothetical protein
MCSPMRILLLQEQVEPKLQNCITETRPPIRAEERKLIELPMFNVSMIEQVLLN